MVGEISAASADVIRHQIKTLFGHSHPEGATRGGGGGVHLLLQPLSFPPLKLGVGLGFSKKYIVTFWRVPEGGL